jgi:hypothetical protein
MDDYMCISVCVRVRARECGCVHLGRKSVQKFQCLILSSCRPESTKYDIQ